MKSKFSVLLIVLILFSAGCADFVGPGPTNQKFAKAVGTLPMAPDTLYSTMALWFPNKIFSAADSFGGAVTEGRLFVTPERLVFAAYDQQTNSFLQAYEVSYSNITWMTWRIQLGDKILRIQTNNSVHSFFLFDREGWSKEGGEGLDIPQKIMEYVLSRVQ